MKKRLFAILLTLCMVLSMLPTAALAAEADVWDGTTATAFAGGTGTADDPWLIATGAQLSYLSEQTVYGSEATVGKYYKLANDIDLDGQAFQPIAYFEGNLDGDGYTISGLDVDVSGDTYAGLIGKGINCTISNLTIEESSISGATYAGGIVAYLTGDSTIYNCATDCAVRGANGTGGIVGIIYREDSTIAVDSCLARGSVNGTSCTGGIVGQVDCYGAGSRVAITGCVNENSHVTGGQKIGGIAGSVEYTAITNCVNTGIVYGNDYVGGIAGYVNFHVYGGRYYYSPTTDSYNRGPVEGETEVGGIWGASTSTGNAINRAYNIGMVINSEGGAVSDTVSTGTCRNTYYMTCVNPSATNASGATGKTMAAMLTVAAYEGFDFENTWVMGSDYPFPELRNLKHDGSKHLVDRNAAAFNNWVFYPTLEDAVAGAAADTQVQALTDVTIDSTITIPSDVCIDFSADDIVPTLGENAKIVAETSGMNVGDETVIIRAATPESAAALAAIVEPGENGYVSVNGSRVVLKKQIYYTITWMNGSEVLDTDEVEQGATPKFEGETPTKDSTIDTVYTFNGWTSDNKTVYNPDNLPAATQDVTYYASFTSGVRQYKVTWIVNETTKFEDLLNFNTVITYKHDYPSKPEDQQYTYKFAGWDKQYENVRIREDMTFTAQYTPELQRYTVIWNDADGNHIETDSNVLYGSVPVYNNPDPTKEATAQYTYTFDGWTNGDKDEEGNLNVYATENVPAIKGNTTLTAHYAATVNTYTVKWVVNDVETVETYEYGAEPTYKGSTDKAGNEEFTYVFTGWDKDVTPVTEDVTYTAQYRNDTNEYTVTWDVNGLLTTETYKYGETPVFKGSTDKAATEQYEYTFDKWDKDIVAVTGNVTYTAEFIETVREYTVTWDVNGVQTTTKVAYGTQPVFEGDTAKEPSVQFTYTFNGWRINEETVYTPEELPVVTGDVTYVATYTESIREYTVTWSINGVSYPMPYKYSEMPTCILKTDKEPDAQYTYTFAGWDKEITAVTEDVTYTAQYDTTVNTYTVTWAVGAFTFTQTYEYGKLPYFESPSLPNSGDYTYTFRGWKDGSVNEETGEPVVYPVDEIPAVTGDVTYTADFLEAKKQFAITWVIGKQTFIDHVDIHTMPECPFSVELAPDDDYTYGELTGWEPALAEVTADTTYTAQYANKVANVAKIIRTNVVEEQEVEETIYFTNFDEAVAAAQAGETVELLTDAEGTGIVINKDITIDFGGCTYTFTEGVGSTGTESNGFQILKGNSVTLKNGTLQVAEEAADKFYILVQNYADLTVTDMTLDGTNLDKWALTDGDSYTLSNNSGAVVIDGATTIIANNDGDLAFAFDACKYGNYAEPTVTVSETVVIEGKVKAAAKAGNVYYATLADAVAKAEANATITLLAADQSATVDKEMTIVKNGFDAEIIAAEGFISYENEAKTAYVVETADLGKIRHAARSLSLDGAIIINQYLYVDGFEGIDIEANGGVLFFKEAVTAEEATVENPKAIDQAGLTYDADKTRYGQVSHDIAAKEYGDTIYIRAYVKDNNGNYHYGELMEYGVRAYCEGRLEKSSDQLQKNICVALLHYGAAAQEYFDYNLDNLANSGIAEQYPNFAWDDALLDDVDVATTNIPASANVAVTNKSLSLEGAIIVNFYSKVYNVTAEKVELLLWRGVEGELTLDNVTEIKETEYDAAKGRYDGVSMGIFAKNYGQTVFACAKLTDTNGDVHYSEIIGYSPEAYAASRLEKSTDENLKELVKAMTIYGEQARIFFEN